MKTHPTILLTFLIVFNLASSTNPELLNISAKDSCIKDVVKGIMKEQDCSRLSQESKSKLSLEMTNCLLLKLGKERVECEKISSCKLEGDSWNTFTTFFAHIDNLCHFYWQVSKTERTDEMISALIDSASYTQKTLNKNAQNTEMILELQNSLRISMLSSIATQQQMSQIINNSSLKISQITANLEESFNRIHSQLDSHYSSISRVLSGISEALSHINALSSFILGQVNTVSGILYYLTLTLTIIVFSLLNKKVNLRRNDLLVIIGINFTVEFFFFSFISVFVEIKIIRYLNLVLMFIMVIATKVQESQFQDALLRHLNTARMKRIVKKALNDMNQIDM